MTEWFLTMFIPGYILIIALVFLIAFLDTRRIQHGSWDWRWQCNRCGHIVDRRRSCCPSCGVNSLDGKHVKCRAVGLAGWEFDEDERPR